MNSDRTLNVPIITVREVLSLTAMRRETTLIEIMIEVEDIISHMAVVVVDITQGRGHIEKEMERKVDINRDIGGKDRRGTMMTILM